MYIYSLLTLVLLAVSAFGQAVVEGTVKDTAGEPVKGVKVSLERQDGRTAQISATDTEGRFQFSAVEAGPYEIKTNASGFYASSYHLTIRPRQPLSIAIELQTTQ